MAKISNKDLIDQIESSLSFDTFIPYNCASDFICGLERVKSKIDILLKNRKAMQAVPLYAGWSNF